MKHSLIFILLLNILFLGKLDAQDTSFQIIEHTDNILLVDSTSLVDEDLPVADIQSDLLSLDEEDVVSTRDDSGLALLFGGLAFLILFLILAVAVVFLIVFSLIILSGLNIISRPALAALWTKSYTSSFNTLFFISSACTFSGIGGLVGFLTNQNYHYTTPFMAVMIGLVIGLILRDKKQTTYNNILFSTRIYSSILEESH